MNAEIAKHRPEINALCEQYGVIALDLFGSATGIGFNPVASDFDFVATFSETGPSSDYGGRFLDFCIALEKLLGRSVDVITPESIKRASFREAVDASRRRIYESKSHRATA